MMRMWKKTVLTAAAAAVLVGAGGFGCLTAQPAEAAAGGDEAGLRHVRLLAGMHGMYRGGLFAACSERLAQLLGMTQDELRTALRDGKTLADLAKEKGVDKQQLVDVVAGEMSAGLERRFKEGKIDRKRYELRKAGIPAAAVAIVDGRMPHSGKAIRISSSEEMAKLLGMTRDELRTALQQDRTLADIAKEQGVDRQKVVDLVVRTMTERLDEKRKAGKLTPEQYDRIKAGLPEKADKIVNGELRMKGGGRGHGAPR